jgi:1,4-alpha-glucan branching enzyme
MTEKKSLIHTGMGAIPFEDGVAFRVWAPNADEVFVIGSFNDWSDSAHPMSHEENGFWYAKVSDAKTGDQYKFLIRNGDQKLERIDPYARKVTSSVGNGIIRDPQFDWGSTNFKMPNWNELVIYELHIGTFNDRPGGPPGNLNSAIQKLPHLKELGINAIEVMPVMEFAGGFSWGYNPALIFAIESDYGGAKAFKDFVKAAHELGIAVIFDVVYNHLGPSDLSLWQFDGWSENDKGGIYFYNDGRSQTPWGDTRPDYGRSKVRQYLRDNALMWLNEFRVDGLRWDMTAFIRNVHGNDNDPDNDLFDGWSLMQWINQEAKKQQPWKISIAEDMQMNHAITQDVDAGGTGFDAQWDSSFVHTVRSIITTSNDTDRDMNALRDVITHRFNADAFERVVYTESHDEIANGQARVPEEIDPGKASSWYAKKRSTLGAALVFTAPGIPMLFQGQEFLEDDWFHDQDPIDWTKKQKYHGIFQLYRDLIALRLNKKNSTRGLTGQKVNVFHVNNNDKVIAFHRWRKGGAGDSVIIVANFADRNWDNYTIGFPRGGIWKVRFNSDWNGYDSEFGNVLSTDTRAVKGRRDGLPCNGNVDIGAYSVIVLSQDN